MQANDIDDVLRILDGIIAKVAFLGRLIAQPSGRVAQAVDLIRATESKDVPAIIDALNSIVPAGGAVLP